MGNLLVAGVVLVVVGVMYYAYRKTLHSKVEEYLEYRHSR